VVRDELMLVLTQRTDTLSTLGPSAFRWACGQADADAVDTALLREATEDRPDADHVRKCWDNFRRTPPGLDSSSLVVCWSALMPHFAANPGSG
jgi:hypothetical protein